MNLSTHLWRFPALLDSHTYAPSVRRGSQQDIRQGLKALLTRLPQAREGAPATSPVGKRVAERREHPPAPQPPAVDVQ